MKDKVEITLPENISEITLEQFQRYDKLMKRTDLDEFNRNKRLIEIFCGITFREVDNIGEKDYDDILGQIAIALTTNSEFIPRFTHNGVDLGFIPNFDKITTAEYVDLSTHGIDVENLHKTMAVLFRPVTGKDPFGNYKIAEYNGTSQYADMMRGIPMNVVNGALVFFYNLANELQDYTLRYTMEARRKEKAHLTTSLSGDGMLR